MSRRGGGGTAASSAWAPDEVALFFEAFHQHGPSFEQIAAAVGGGRTAEACEALHRRHASYLAIPREFQSVQAFTAMVENAQKEAAAEQPSGGGGGGEEGAGSGGGAGSRLKHEDAEEEEEGEGDDAQASGRDGAEEGTEDGDDAEPGLAAGRSRRTPKRSSLRTPQSASKRGRGDESIYEYYGEGVEAVTESARKRRAPRSTIDFPTSQRRRHDTDEAKGIDALLALAVAGEESLGGMDSEDGGSEQAAAAARGRKGKGRARTPQRRGRQRVAEDEDEDYEPADAGEMDDDKEDEDFAPPASRRTPYSTPAKAGRLGRPGSAHATPRRSGGRSGGAGVSALAAASPAGLALRGFSPFHMLAPLESGGDMLTDMGLADLGYITSPGFPQFQQGFVPSPQNPMPRLRRRKSAPERVPPSVSSPIRTLFTRRSSMAGPLLPGFGYAAGDESAAAAGGASAVTPQSAAEAQLRHCLQQPRTQRWAAAEFCCSALDRPFFMFNPLSGLLTAMGLGQDARLTRKEWAIIRSGLGKPRRLSLRFLREERARLERWREGCREQYQSGAAAADPKVADHLPRPLGVGQRVVARHPSTRQLHDGSVLTVAHNCYRVQFDRQELGVELVRDTDVFPCDPTENLPPAVLLGTSRLLLNGRAVINGQPVRPLAPPRPLGPPAGLPAAAVAAAAAASTPLPTLPTSSAAGGLLPAGTTPEPGSAAAAAPPDSSAPTSAEQPQTARSADAKALAELVVGLDKKEALLLQLRAMNDEAAAGVHSADAGGSAAPGFVGAYAGVVLQLKEVNDKVREKLEELESSGVSGEAAPSGERGAAALGDTALQHQQLGASLAADAALQRQLAAHSPEALSASAAAEAQRIISTCRAKLEESAAAEQDEGGEEEQVQSGGGTEASTPPGAAAGAGQQRQEQQQQQQLREQRGASPAEGSPPDAAAAASSGGGESAQQRSMERSQEPRPAPVWSGAHGQQLASLIEGCVHSLVLLQQGAGANGGLPPRALGAALDAALASVAPKEAANAALFEEVKAAMAGLKLQIGAVAM